MKKWLIIHRLIFISHTTTHAIIHQGHISWMSEEHSSQIPTTTRTDVTFTSLIRHIILRQILVDQITKQRE